ncbi:MAG: choice-of-anchor Q domain-containing protein [Polyangiaceae bacterium]
MSVSLDNVVIRDSEAHGQLVGGIPEGGMGGAIFLSVNNAGISATDSTFRDNTAYGPGGAIAMVCKEDLVLASHSISLTNSLLVNNTAQWGGAGAIEACGVSTIALATSTLSNNHSVAMPRPLPATAEARGAVSYMQNIVSGQGSVSLSNITAAEHEDGPVFAFKALSAVTLNSSVLIGNDGHNCALDSALSFPSGNYNTIDDSSCNALLLTSGGAKFDPGTGQFANELLPLFFRGGLTEVYLPNKNSTNVLNVGTDGDNCSGSDQRGLSRKNGEKCDRGAAERMEPTAVDDSASNGTDSRASSFWMYLPTTVLVKATAVPITLRTLQLPYAEAVAIAPILR